MDPLGRVSGICAEKSRLPDRSTLSRRAQQVWGHSGYINPSQQITCNGIPI
jgi:hypothetical protein